MYFTTKTESLNQAKQLLLFSSAKPIQTHHIFSIIFIYLITLDCNWKASKQKKENETYPHSLWLLLRDSQQ